MDRGGRDDRGGQKLRLAGEKKNTEGDFKKEKACEEQMKECRGRDGRGGEKKIKMTRRYRSEGMQRIH